MNLKRLLLNTAITLITLPAAAFLADWAIWRIKQSHGTGMSTVSVTCFVVAPLKGGKEEYYPDGTVDLDCSQSLFPQAGGGACWWLQRHHIVFDR